MSPRLLRVALTGGIATGKSHCLRRFAGLGVPVIDADVLARAVVAPGTPGLDAIVQRFGTGTLSADGSLDRDALARVVFRDAAERRALEAIVHPAVYAAIEQWFSETSASSARLAIADIPLLFETGHDRDFDRVVVAACTPEHQMARLMAREKLPEAEARQRMAAQLPIGEKRARADYVVDTNGTPYDTDVQIVEIWERLRAEALNEAS